MSLQTEFVETLKGFTHLQQQARMDRLVQSLENPNIKINDSLENYWYIFWLGVLLYQEIPEIKNHPKNEQLKKRLHQYINYLDENYTPHPRLTRKR